MLGKFMESEIREQPYVLRAQGARYFDEIKPRLRGDYEMAVLVARGSSDHAALYLRYLLEIHIGLPVVLAAPSVLTQYERQVRYKKALIVGISQSGAAPDVSEVLAATRAQGHTTLAITNTPGSLMTRVAEYTLLLGAGTEKSVAATKTYSASLLACYQVARALGADLPDPIAELPDESWVSEAETSAENTFGPLTRSNPDIILARGYSYCTAHETALKLMECALIPAKAYSTADFQHGPKALAGPGSAAIVFSGPIDELLAQGCLAAHSPECAAPDPLKPLYEVIYSQFLALLCARGRGLDPDHPQNLKKVTETR